MTSETLRAIMRRGREDVKSPALRQIRRNLGQKHPRWALGGKLGEREWALSFGVGVAQLVLSPQPTMQSLVDHLTSGSVSTGQRMVLKSNRGTHGRGVWSIEIIDKLSVMIHRRGRSIQRNWSNIVRQADLRVQRGEINGPFFVEESLHDTHGAPNDF